MANQDEQHEQRESEEALQLNKETVQDLDVEATDQELVKGGQIGRQIISVTCSQPSDNCPARAGN
jgi:hypothetical protein